MIFWLMILTLFKKHSSHVFTSFFFLCFKLFSVSLTERIQMFWSDELSYRISIGKRWCGCWWSSSPGARCRYSHLTETQDRRMKINHRCPADRRYLQIDFRSQWNWCRTKALWQTYWYIPHESYRLCPSNSEDFQNWSWLIFFKAMIAPQTRQASFFLGWFLEIEKFHSRSP